VETGEVIGALAANLVNGLVVFTPYTDTSEALSAEVQCGVGPYVTSLEVRDHLVDFRALILQQNANPSTYPYLTAIALYADTLEAGSPNWALLSTCRPTHTLALDRN
jgi:hypothetical protein